MVKRKNVHIEAEVVTEAVEIIATEETAIEQIKPTSELLEEALLKLNNEYVITSHLTSSTIKEINEIQNYYVQLVTEEFNKLSSNDVDLMIIDFIKSYFKNQIVLDLFYNNNRDYKTIIWNKTYCDFNRIEFDFINNFMNRFDYILNNYFKNTIMYIKELAKLANPTVNYEFIKNVYLEDLLQIDNKENRIETNLEKEYIMPKLFSEDAIKEILNSNINTYETYFIEALILNHIPRNLINYNLKKQLKNEIYGKLTTFYENGLNFQIDIFYIEAVLIIYNKIKNKSEEINKQIEEEAKLKNEAVKNQPIPEPINPF